MAGEGLTNPATGGGPAAQRGFDNTLFYSLLPASGSYANSDAGRMYFVPFYIPTRVTVARFYINIGGSSVGSFKTAVYRNNDQGSPGTRVALFGEQGVSAGVNTITAGATLDAGWYWFGFLQSGANQFNTSQSAVMDNVVNGTVSAAFATGTTVGYAGRSTPVTYASGPPASFSAGASAPGLENVLPAVALQVQ